MKKIFTLIAAVFSVVTANAQTWDLSTWENQAVTGTVTDNGLTYYGEAKSAYAAGSKTFADGQTFTGRIKLGGGSTFQTDNFVRVFEFEATKGSTLNVYAIHGSSSGDDRLVYVSQTPSDTKNDASTAFGHIATVAGAETPNVLTATVPATGKVYVWAGGNVGIYAITVKNGEGGGDTPSGDAESMTFATWDADNSVVVPNPTLNIPLANTAQDSIDGSYMKMNKIVTGTANMDVVFTSGPISQNVKVNETAAPESTDPGFLIYYQNFYKLDKKNDFGNANGELEPIAFVQGYGNPCADQTHTPTWNEEKSKWGVTQVFTYYQPDGSVGLPTNGSYLEFTPKQDGKLVTRVYILKGNRPFYIVDEDTKCALDTTQYSAWGCANGQKISGTSILRYEQLSHGTVPVTSEAGDTIGWKPNYCLWFPGQKANQHIVADVTFNVKSGKTYMMFCGNTQIGISGYTFTPTGTTAIQTVTATEPKADNRCFNLSGQQVAPDTKGIIIRNGKKYLNR